MRAVLGRTLRSRVKVDFPNASELWPAELCFYFEGESSLPSDGSFLLNLNLFDKALNSLKELLLKKGSVLLDPQKSFLMDGVLVTADIFLRTVQCLENAGLPQRLLTLEVKFLQMPSLKFFHKLKDRDQGVQALDIVFHKGIVQEFILDEFTDLGEKKFNRWRVYWNARSFNKFYSEFPDQDFWNSSIKEFDSIQSIDAKESFLKRFFSLKGIELMSIEKTSLGISEEKASSEIYNGQELFFF